MELNYMMGHMVAAADTVGAGWQPPACKAITAIVIDPQ
jgi:hypothetical protein